MFVKYAYVVFPCGLGMPDELAEILTQTQSGKSKKTPIFMLDSGLWQRLLDWLQEKMIAEMTINKGDLELISVIDGWAQVVNNIIGYYKSTGQNTIAAIVMVDV